MQRGRVPRIVHIYYLSVLPVGVPPIIVMIAANVPPDGAQGDGFPVARFGVGIKNIGFVNGEIRDQSGDGDLYRCNIVIVILVFRYHFANAYKDIVSSLCRGPFNGTGDGFLAQKDNFPVTQCAASAVGFSIEKGHGGIYTFIAQYRIEKEREIGKYVSTGFEYAYGERMISLV